jgi:hypothetical protein
VPRKGLGSSTSTSTTFSSRKFLLDKHIVSFPSNGKFDIKSEMFTALMFQPASVQIIISIDDVKQNSRPLIAW